MRRHVIFRLTRVALLMVCGAVPLTCDTSTEPAKPGWLGVTLQTPNSDDGAVLFSVAGGLIDSVRSSFPNAFAKQIGEQSWRVIVAGTVTAGRVAEIWVPDVNAEGYTATIEQIAVRGSYVQRATTGYGLTIE
ncbi:MAG TPA: hypothetical protein VGA37_08575 [Gemmatimonadales bacterium]